MSKPLILISFLLIAGKAYCQKYNFVNWTVEDGLIQSQASFICQDHYRQLWIGTEGGISRFDGKEFTAYTVHDGLAANHINTMLCDQSGNMWIGTNYGISFYNGRDFKTIKPLEGPVNSVTSLVQTDQGDLYATDNLRLLRIQNFKGFEIIISGDSAEKITALYKTGSNGLLAAVHHKGIYAMQQNSWRCVARFNTGTPAAAIRKILITHNFDTLLAGSHGLLVIRQGKIVPYTLKGLKDLEVTCMLEDKQHNIWLGTDRGAYKLQGETLIHFDEKSGFTDNGVEHIFMDSENNLWFATNANGIYKFRENTFIYYDNASGLASPIIMGVVQTSDGNIYAGGYGGGLYTINKNGGIEPVKQAAALQNSRINSLYADNENNVWIGTLDKDTYIYNEKNGLKKIEDPHQPELFLRGAVSFIKTTQGNMLISTNRGLYLLRPNGKLSRLNNPAPLVTTLRQFDSTHVLAGTSKGLFLLEHDSIAKPVNEKKFGNASVLCLAKNGSQVWIGTTDEGVMNWNYKTGKIVSYTTENGLPSNFIYSINAPGKNTAWIGTGFGISNLTLADNDSLLSVKNYGRSDGLLGMECNHNSLLRAADSGLWFGTTRGLFHFNPSAGRPENNQPLVLLRSVKLFSSEITDSSLFQNAGAWFAVPQGLRLHSRQNHLTFELNAIYFTNPGDVLYRYKLEGIDKGFTTTGNPIITYPALPPGRYVLKVTGITKSGILSVNEITYAFIIEKAFYQTRLFQLLVVLLLLGTGAFMAYIFTKGRQKRKQKEKEKLELIREEEFTKLRQRTAEDFHDEMGNNLTRISVLTDVLKSKLNGGGTDVSRLVQQIKENTTALYNGSRDIIWSLNSQNDGLFAIAEHLRDIGQEVFQETNIDFQFSHNIHAGSHLKLKLDYSRNLTMIFKEAYNNILKHSGAQKVKVVISLNADSDLNISIADDGKGFGHGATQGNGLKNMKSRTARMNGEIEINTSENKGTEIGMRLNHIFILP